MKGKRIVHNNNTTNNKKSPFSDNKYHRKKVIYYTFRYFEDTFIYSFHRYIFFCSVRYFHSSILTQRLLQWMWHCVHLIIPHRCLTSFIRLSFIFYFGQTTWFMMAFFARQFYYFRFNYRRNAYLPLDFLFLFCVRQRIQDVQHRRNNMVFSWDIVNLPINWNWVKYSTGRQINYRQMKSNHYLLPLILLRNFASYFFFLLLLKPI